MNLVGHMIKYCGVRRIWSHTNLMCCNTGIQYNITCISTIGNAFWKMVLTFSQFFTHNWSPVFSVMLHVYWNVNFYRITGSLCDTTWLHQEGMYTTPSIGGRVDVGTRIFINCYHGYYRRCTDTAFCMPSGRMEPVGMMCHCQG